MTAAVAVQRGEMFTRIGRRENMMSGYMQKEYKLPNGRTVTADFNELGCAMVTIQAMDALFDILNSSVEVVRCKDCKHYRIWEMKCDRLHTKPFADNHYCSYGERADT